MSQATTQNAQASSDSSAQHGLAMVHTRTLVGVQAAPVVVEVHLANGLPSFNIVGLAETAIKESKERVRAAITNAGFEFPARRITVNLSPADLPKTGSQFDLPIAIGVLIAASQLPARSIQHFEFIGELSLDGQLHSVRGTLPCVWEATKAKRAVFVPPSNCAEASLVEGAEVYSASTLLKVCHHVVGQTELDVVHLPMQQGSPESEYNMADVIGQSNAKRALEIAAAGGHNMLMIGPPGAGKSMLAQRMPSILPHFDISDAIASASIRSIAGDSIDPSTWKTRPFRSPHHSCSSVALVGGGSIPKPGEVSQAHGGVLFLDEITEFTRHALEQLREPLETGHINIARANHRVQFPANCLLLAACNPCKCGYYGDPTDRCRCSAASLLAYQSKLSGPLMDRIDLHVKLQAVKLQTLESKHDNEESSSIIRSRVTTARHTQQRRQSCLNSQLEAQRLDEYLRLSTDDSNFFVAACEKLQLSARGFYRVKKLALTISDLSQQSQVNRQALAEALSYRSLV